MKKIFLAAALILAAMVSCTKQDINGNERNSIKMHPADGTEQCDSTCTCGGNCNGSCDGNCNGSCGGNHGSCTNDTCNGNGSCGGNHGNGKGHGRGQH